MSATPVNTANLLTISRIALIPPLVAMIIASGDDLIWPALALYIFMALTDWLDGYLARHMNQKSEFGRFLDPIADKILVMALFMALIANGTLNGWWLALPIIILTREFLISGLREFLGPRNVTVHVTKLAKWKTTVQMIALGFLIPAKLYIDAAICGNLLLLLATVLTVITGWQYIRAAMPHLKG
jgi:cardiolipin synthase